MSKAVHQHREDTAAITTLSNLLCFQTALSLGRHTVALLRAAGVNLKFVVSMAACIICIGRILVKSASPVFTYVVLSLTSASYHLSNGNSATQVQTQVMLVQQLIDYTTNSSRHTVHIILK